MWRVNKTDIESSKCKSWLICPSHTEHLGNGWRTGKKKCQVVIHDKKCQKSPKQGANSSMVQELKKVGQFLQIGEREYF